MQHPIRTLLKDLILAFIAPFRFEFGPKKSKFVHYHGRMEPDSSFYRPVQRPIVSRAPKREWYERMDKLEEKHYTDILAGGEK